jgi:hypothetical protein
MKTIANRKTQSTRNAKCPCGSGKKFKMCHGAPTETPTETLKLVEAPSSVLVKLDLACGQNIKDGFEGVDIAGEQAKHKVDLWKFPWPWADSSVDELWCSHHIEHIPAREIEERDLVDLKHTELLGQDMFFAFFDECWRILKKDSFMRVICPAVRSTRAFWDPTHRRYIDQVTFLYLNEEWRKLQKLDHYQVRANFGVETAYSAPQIELARAAEVHSDRFHHMWNVIEDWIVTLKCIK